MNSVVKRGGSCLPPQCHEIASLTYNPAITPPCVRPTVRSEGCEVSFDVLFGLLLKPSILFSYEFENLAMGDFPILIYMVRLIS